MSASPSGSRSSRRRGIRQFVGARVLGFAVSVVLLASACGPKTEIVYIDPKDHDASGHAAYTPIGRSHDPRVHEDGAHELAQKVQIGPDAGDGHGAPYTPIGRTHDPRVHASGKHQVASKVTLAHERSGSQYDDHAPATGSSHGVDSGHATTPPPVPTPAPKPATVEKPVAAAAKPAASPTPVPPPNLTMGLGTSPEKPSATAPLLDDGDDDEFETVAGKIENVAGRSLLVETASGKARVRVADNVRVDRDALGSPSDLKPGMFVGVLHAMAGPATSVRIYPTGPSMPRPGVVPMAGSRVGQVTTFGSIIALQFGGMLLNTGGETTTVTLPGTVEILRPAGSAATELVAGAQIIASGTVTGDGTVVATGVRVTAPSQPVR
jgi:hypothetical protein